MGQTDTAITTLSAHEVITNDWHDAMQLLVDADELSGSSRRTYEKGVDKFIAWRDGASLDVGEGSDMLRHWKSYLKQQGYKPGSIAVWFAGVKAFYQWAVSSKRMMHNPALGIRGPKRRGANKRHKRDALTNGEVRRLLSMPDRDTATGARDYAILCLMVYGGVRSIEVHRALRQDLRTYKGKRILDVRGKGYGGENDRDVYILGELEAAMLDWLWHRGKDKGPLFTSLSNRSMGSELSLSSIRRMVKGYMVAAGVDDTRKTTHSLRHTAGSNAARAAASQGKPLTVVQTFLGHASIDTTTIYTHDLVRHDDPIEQYIDYGEGAR